MWQVRIVARNRKNTGHGGTMVGMWAMGNVDMELIALRGMLREPQAPSKKPQHEP